MDSSNTEVPVKRLPHVASSAPVRLHVLFPEHAEVADNKKEDVQGTSPPPPTPSSAAAPAGTAGNEATPSIATAAVAGAGCEGASSSSSAAAASVIPSCPCPRQHLVLGQTYAYCTCGLSKKQVGCRLLGVCVKSAYGFVLCRFFVF
jgi:hypothetical protein